MPANLNALIRYKTINSCLYGGKRKYDIHELIEACSDALNEARGRGAGISERTVRDDIRVMRSEILGFNAPIEQKDGLYFYSNPEYTIFSVGITDPGIIDAVIKSLLRIRNEIKHPELEIVLEKLKAISPESFKIAKVDTKKSKIKITHYHKIRQEIIENIEQENVRYRFQIKESDIDLDQKPMMSFSLDPGISVSWGDLMKTL